MSGISCHVLDTSLGRPAAGIEVRLERLAEDDDWQSLAAALTNADGRAAGLEGVTPRALGPHRLTFELEEYFGRTSQASFFPRVQVEFIVSSLSEKYHVPLLLSPFGYCTYRGS
ncbi:MAG TPA: hydroxyisourate hydrolase [Polyangiaceae bacterium]|jgi:5-hydroxyisourate hydrolase|nr:hydroxyisourate hydrolase [Polyangiaceae bacterium]